MNQLIATNKEAIFDLCEKNHVESLYLFGSITDAAKFNSSSDIDILVSFDMTKISLEEYTEAYFNLTFELEDLLGRKIDIVTERSVVNPYFKAELDKTKVLLFHSLAEIDG